MKSEMPAATEPRSKEDGDWMALEMFSPADLKMSHEEYAARHAHLWACFSFDSYHYHDPILADWMRRLGEILKNKDEVDRCRQRFLTPEELATVREQETDEF